MKPKNLKYDSPNSGGQFFEILFITKFVVFSHVHIYDEIL
jgi:hypothetical protein